MIQLSAIKTQGEVEIAYLDSKVYADEKLIPLVICPGLSETAEEYLELIEYMLPRRTIVLSFRGRGLSDTPTHGYNLLDHYLKPTKRIEQIREEAVIGIQRDSTDEDLTIAFEKSVLLIYGALEGSLITSEQLKRYKEHFNRLEIVRLEQSGHDIRGTEEAIVNRSIKEFLANV